MRMEDIEKMLFIQKHRLDDELEVQAEIQWRISKELADANSYVQSMKDRRDEIESEITAKSDASVAKTQAAVKADPYYQKAQKLYTEAKRVAELWAGLHSAWVSRGFSLKSLGDLYGHDYFTVDSHTVKDSKISDARRVLHEDRQTRRVAPALTEPAPVRRRTITS